VVIENDIAWRVQTMVDFMFGKPVRILSTAADEETRARTIERVLDAVWEASGGIGLMQDAALLGHVHGYVDLLVRIDEAALTKGGRRRRAGERGAGISLSLRACPDRAGRAAARVAVLSDATTTGGSMRS
jgi:hypothetical protein